jgi:haloacetate dehalogenase
MSRTAHNTRESALERPRIDHPDRIDRLAVLDILPTETAWERADARLALAYWPRSLLAQPEPLLRHR